MVIRILDIVDRCYSNEDGQAVYHQIKPRVIAGAPFTLSFAGVSAVTSSFVNSALIDLLDSVDFDQIKRTVKITDVSQTVAQVIKRRFTFETQERVSA